MKPLFLETFSYEASYMWLCAECDTENYVGQLPAEGEPMTCGHCGESFEVVNEKIHKPYEITIIRIVVDHYIKSLTVFTKTDSFSTRFSEYDYWGSLKLDGVSLDFHIEYDEYLEVSFHPLVESADGHLRNVSLGTDYTITYSAPNWDLVEIGKPLA